MRGPAEDLPVRVFLDAGGCDAPLSPQLAHWIRECAGFDAVPVRELGLRDASDEAILMAARDAEERDFRAQ